jgi:sulfite exporter TauE/SafE
MNTQFYKYLLEGSALGLLTGISCAVFCIPILLGLSGRDINNITPVKDFLFFLAGRLIAYIFIGFIFSLIGVQLKINSLVEIIVKFIAGILLLYWGIKTFIAIDKEKTNCSAKKFSRTIPFIAGIMTGISPCPPFITGIARVISIRNIFAGMIYFLGFYVTTSLFLIPGLTGVFFKYKKEFKIIVSLFSVIFGIIFLITGIIGIAGLI